MPDDIAELQQAIVLLKLALEHQQGLTAERFAERDKALTAALISNDKRLDGMNEFRASISDLSRQMLTRSEFETSHNALANKTSGEMRVLSDKFDIITKPNYILGVSLLTAILIMIGGLWTVTGLKIDTAINPVQITIEQLHANQIAHDREFAGYEQRLRDVGEVGQSNKTVAAELILDRAHLNERMRANESSLAKHEIDYHVEMAEINTMITRLNVWADFLQAKVFPNTPVPPMKQP